MKIKKLTLREITKVYIFLEPYLEKDKEFLTVLIEVFADDKGKQLLKFFYNEEIPDNDFTQIYMIEDAVVKNNLYSFIGFMLEITNG